MRAIPLSIVLLVMMSCAGSSMPSMQDSILATASLIETMANSAQAAYEAGQIDNDQRQSIADNLQTAQNYAEMANDAFREQDGLSAFSHLTQAIRIIEAAQIIMGDLQ